MDVRPITPLKVIDGKSLLTLDIDPPRFIVSRLLPVGLHILAGSPKIGKSWFALWLCQQVSTGQNIWEFESQQCGTLYLSLEDTLDRLHFRLSRLTEDGSETSHFATEADNISGTLPEQLELFLKEYPDTGLVVIDTLQRIRDASNDKATYAGDYTEIAKIKAVADRYKIAILLVHHLRKAPDSDPFNMVSGSTGIIGAVDSIYVLEKDKRAENLAKLHVTGRDISDMQLQLEFDRDAVVWRFISYLTEMDDSANKVIEIVMEVFRANPGFDGTATELLDKIKEVDPANALRPNSLTRLLREYDARLRQSGFIVEYRKVKGVKRIRVSMVDEFMGTPCEDSSTPQNDRGPMVAMLPPIQIIDPSTPQSR